MRSVIWTLYTYTGGYFYLQIFFLAGNFSSLVFYFRNQPRKNKNKNILHSIMWSHQLCIGLKLGWDNWHCIFPCVYGGMSDRNAQLETSNTEHRGRTKLDCHCIEAGIFLKFMGGRVTGIRIIILIVILVDCRPSFWFYVSFLPIANHDKACSHLDKFV